MWQPPEHWEDGYLCLGWLRGEWWIVERETWATGHVWTESGFGCIPEAFAPLPEPPPDTHPQKGWKMKWYPLEFLTKPETWEPTMNLRFVNGRLQQGWMVRGAVPKIEWADVPDATPPSATHPPTKGMGIEIHKVTIGQNVGFQASAAPAELPSDTHPQKGE